MKKAKDTKKSSKPSFASEVKTDDDEPWVTKGLGPVPILT